jgi:hypothetical protein
MRCRCLGIEGVSCEQHRSGVLLAGVLSEPGDDVVSSFPQAAGQVTCKIAETLS